MKFIITVDTEADNQWQRSKNISLENIKHIPRFQELCQKYNFNPTYLVTYEVATDNTSSNILSTLAKDNKAEIGAHLHPWTTPPYTRDMEWEMTHHRFPSELPLEELGQKIRSLTEGIKSKFNIEPKSFRAGRWGFDSNVARVIKEYGYIADSSITPGISWKRTTGDPKGVGGPNYKNAQIVPYELSIDNILENGKSGVIEIPMTILPTGSLVERSLRKVFHKNRWLRIFPETKASDLVEIYKTASRLALPYIQFMIHSSELMSGGSPYSKEKKNVENTYYILESFFDFLTTNSVGGVSLSQFALSFAKELN